MKIRQITYFEFENIFWIHPVKCTVCCALVGATPCFMWICRASSFHLSDRRVCSELRKVAIFQCATSLEPVRLNMQSTFRYITIFCPKKIHLPKIHLKKNHKKISIICRTRMQNSNFLFEIKTVWFSKCRNCSHW